MIGKRGDLFPGGILFRGGFDPTLQKTGGIYSGGGICSGGIWSVSRIKANDWSMPLCHLIG